MFNTAISSITANMKFAMPTTNHILCYRNEQLNHILGATSTVVYILGAYSTIIMHNLIVWN